MFEFDKIKNEPFGKTSLFFKVVKIQNEAALRDFPNFWAWQHPKRSNSARFLSKMEKKCRPDGLVPMYFAIFLIHLSKVLYLPGKSDTRSYEVLYLSRKIILANRKIWYQEITPLPPPSSDKHVSCTAPATENASLQILFTCPKCYKTLIFCWLLTRSTIPCACHAKRHPNLQKWCVH